MPSGHLKRAQCLSGKMVTMEPKDLPVSYKRHNLPLQKASAAKPLQRKEKQKQKLEDFCFSPLLRKLYAFKILIVVPFSTQQSSDDLQHLKNVMPYPQRIT